MYFTCRKWSLHVGNECICDLFPYFYGEILTPCRGRYIECGKDRQEILSFCELREVAEELFPACLETCFDDPKEIPLTDPRERITRNVSYL